MTKKKKAKKSATLKKTSKKKTLATVKATKKVPAKAAKKTAVKARKKSATKASSKKPSKVDGSNLDDLGIWALTSPDQPVDYDIFVANSRAELIALVKAQLYVQPDGSAWVPQGGAFEEDERWYQTMVKFD